MKIMKNYKEFLTESKFIEEHEIVEDKVKNSKKLSKELKKLLYH